jgi:DNA-binding MarR family transcriptional regulator
VDLTPDEKAAFEGLILKASTVQRQVDRDLIREQNTTLSERVTLQCLSVVHGSRLRMNELAEATNVSFSRITRVVQKLESKGLVIRTRAANDRRGWHAVLTDVGRARLRQSSHSYAISVRRNFLYHFDPEKLQNLLALLERLPPPTTPPGVLTSEPRGLPRFVSERAGLDP